MKKLIFIFLLCAAAQSQALEIAGVTLDDKVQLDKQEVVLNGAGIRTKFLFKIYVAALYLPEKMHTGEAVLADERAKRMSFVLVHDVTAKQVLDGINEAILPNNTEEEMRVLEARLNKFSTMFAAVPDIKVGGVVNLDYIPGLGTRVTVNGVDKGHIEGADFYRSLLKIWIGKKPVKASLKQSVLGIE
jgi:hypothetical protein